MKREEVSEERERERVKREWGKGVKRGGGERREGVKWGGVRERGEEGSEVKGGWRE